MLTFYHSTQTCSTSVRIVLEELQINHTIIEVSWKKRLNVDELKKINPLGSVPVIITEEGKILTQNIAILEYIADLSPSSNLLAPPGTWERRETMSWLSFIASDFHKAFTPFFRLNKMTSSESAIQDIKKYIKSNVEEYISYINNNLTGKDYIMGKQFTIADAYLFIILGWSQFLHINLNSYENIKKYLSNMNSRSIIKKIMKEEE